MESEKSEALSIMILQKQCYDSAYLQAKELRINHKLLEPACSLVISSSFYFASNSDKIDFTMNAVAEDYLNINSNH